jgi:UDP-glucose 4-epimerase
MRILITGGFGYLGGNLAVNLASLGHQIFLGTQKARLIPKWLPDSTVVITEWDNYDALEMVCKSVDAVIHAAGMNAQDCDADPVAALKFNGVATARLIAAASAVGVSRFIYLSSAHVYSNPLVGLINENTCPKNLHPYATSHLAGELAVLRANQLEKIHGTVLRLSNVFGPPIDAGVSCWTLLVNDLCRQAVGARKMVLKTSGMQMRDFLNMSEVFSAVELFLNNQKSSKISGLFNVGSGVSKSVFEMAEVIQSRCFELLGFLPELERVTPRNDDFSTPLNYEIKKLKSVGYKANSQPTQGVDSTILFCHTYGSAE